MKIRKKLNFFFFHRSTEYQHVTVFSQYKWASFGYSQVYWLFDCRCWKGNIRRNEKSDREFGEQHPNETALLIMKHFDDFSFFECWWIGHRLLLFNKAKKEKLFKSKPTSNYLNWLEKKTCSNEFALLLILPLTFRAFCFKLCSMTWVFFLNVYLEWIKAI